MAESPQIVDGLGLEELRSLLVQALEEIARLKAENAELRDEIARLKGLKGRPKIAPSGMEKATQPGATTKGHSKIGRRGSKRAKLTITETKVVRCENVPAGARLKGYEDFIVQDLIVQSKTVLLRRERWLMPTGEVPDPDPGSWRRCRPVSAATSGRNSNASCSPNIIRAKRRCRAWRRCWRTWVSSSPSANSCDC